MTETLRDRVFNGLLEVIVLSDGTTEIWIDDADGPLKATVVTQELRDFLNGVYTGDFVFKKAPKTI